MTDAGKLFFAILAFIAAMILSYMADKHVKQEWMREVIQQEMKKEQTK